MDSTKRRTNTRPHGLDHIIHQTVSKIFRSSHVIELSLFLSLTRLWDMCLPCLSHAKVELTDTPRFTRLLASVIEYNFTAVNDHEEQDEGFVHDDDYRAVIGADGGDRPSRGE